MAAAAPFRGWPKTTQLNGVVGNLLHSVPAEEDGAPPGPPPGPFVVDYRAKVKLHGTCATVVIAPDGAVGAQSRNKSITPEADNCGFASYVHEHRAAWAALKPKDHPLYVYGEWIGQGINQGDAACTLPEKQFCVFAARSGPDAAEHIVEPDTLRALLAGAAIPRLHVLPWLDGVASAIDLLAEDEIDVGAINAAVQTIGDHDLWVAATFGVDGPGEGVVAYPLAINGTPIGPRFDVFRRYFFKAKHPRHSEKRERKPARKKTEVSASAEALAAGCVTPARCDKGMREVDPEKRPASFSQFLAWITADVLDEVKHEMAASNVAPADLQRALAAPARAYWFSL